MKKFLISLSIFLFPTIAFGQTVTINTNNVPFQPTNTSSQVTILIPNNTQIEKISSTGDWYYINYNNLTGWINKAYTAEGAIEKMLENASANQSSSPSTSTSTQYTSQTFSPAQIAPNISTDEKMSRIINAANQYGAQFGLDPYLILAVIKIESYFNPYAISDANCVGLMQINVDYVDEWGIDKNRLKEIEYNIYHGTRLLATLFIPQMGNQYDGLRAYNQGVSGARKGADRGKKYADKIMKAYNTYKQNGFTY